VREYVSSCWIERAIVNDIYCTAACVTASYPDGGSLNALPSLALQLERSRQDQYRQSWSDQGKTDVKIASYLAVVL
jgi:hypothetical protein